MRRIPDGFSPLPPRDNFVERNGPFYHDGRLRFGFMPEEHHCNLLGFTHGGMIATLMDSAMAHSVVASVGYVIVTEQLTIKYISIVAKNRWAEVEVSLEDLIDEEITAKAVLRSRGLICAVGHANFKLLQNRPMQNDRPQIVG